MKAYQEAERPPERTPLPAIAESGRTTLRDYGGSGPPVIFVPSLINPPFVLDLAEDNSLLRWLATQGVRPLLVDWGTPGPESRGEGLDHHIERLLLPLIDAIGEPPLIVGYCLGGTLAIAAATLRPVRGVATIAAPWRFARYSDFALAAMAAQWEASRAACDALGLVPMEVLQSSFWQLDPARTISKYEKFARAEPGSDAARGFVALEDWANGGAPLTFTVGKQMFERFFAGDRPGSGRWWVGGKRILPARLACPATEFVSTTDRIVPAASAMGLPSSHRLSSGHVGMIVGGRARKQLWEPLRDWLIAAAHTK